MRGRVLTWAGGIAALGAGTALAVYLASMGLDKADKLASVIGVLVGLAGLAVGVWGLLLTQRHKADQPAGTDPPPAGAHTGVRNEISGGTFHGPVIQARTVTARDDRSGEG